MPYILVYYHTMDNIIYRSLDTLDKSKYFFATYELEGKESLANAAWELAIGQSVGNPHVRNAWETEQMFEDYSCKVIGDQESLKTVTRGIVTIAFPIVNTDWKEDGVSHLLCQVMGGQMDIDKVLHCRLIGLDFPEEVQSYFKGPKYGVTGVREYLGLEDRPLLGAIVKPKTGITPEILLELVKELVEGGVNFIKEDEILSNPIFCPIEVRVPMIMEYIKSTGKKVIYAVCINADSPYLLERVRRVHELGGNAVHVNFWCGLGSYKAIRDLDLPMFIHFQKSGDKILTDASHRFSIDFRVICQLAGMMGVDFIHSGMWGGYSNTNEAEMQKIIDTLHFHNTIPALSCGMHPGLVKAIETKFGKDLLFNCGGAIHGHPQGTLAGTRAMRQAIDGETEGKEYIMAIEKWGLRH
jgi:ribulose 1,5-bisphosphate carboxylase large subunit-like protein